jgi:hypothetical protein
MIKLIIKINHLMKKIILGIVLLVLISIITIAAFLFLNSDKEIDTDIRGLSVKSGQKITSPLIVEGEARGGWFFEASFPIKITNEQNNILGYSFVQAQTDWMTEDFVPFKGEISYVSENGGNGFLVLSKDNPSGLSEHDKEIKIPINLEATEMITVKVYFNNSIMDPEFSCNKVFAIEREVPKTTAVARASLEELFKGVTSAEENAGFSTNINEGVKIQSLTIENETAKVDFNEQLQYQVGGSCRVSAIRAQIIETLKQFPTVKNVVISINGRTEDILQP